MTTSGILKVSSGISQLNGTRLARQGAGNPFTAATNFLANRGFGNNSPITVDGDNGFVGSVPVIFINSVEAAADRAATRAVAGRAPRKAAKKPAAKKAPGKKRAAKKISRAAKKSAAKKSRKSARKR